MADKKIQEAKVVDKEIKSTEKVETKTEVTSTVEKTLDIKDKQDTIEKISDVKIIGDVDIWKLLCKASSESQGWMKSTKAMNVEHGCLIQVSKQQKNPDGSYSVAEALTYVPNVQINDEGKLDKIVRN